MRDIDNTLGKTCEPQACRESTPVEHLRNKARNMRDSASRLEKLADKLEHSFSWDRDTTQAFFEATR